MTAPLRLSPDSSVALCAYRFPSESKPGTFHDAALMVGDGGDCLASSFNGRHWSQETARGVVCKACHAVLYYFMCDCPDAVYRERPCKHIVEARKLYAAERAARGGE